MTGLTLKRKPKEEASVPAKAEFFPGRVLSEFRDKQEASRAAVLAGVNLSIEAIGVLGTAHMLQQANDRLAGRWLAENQPTFLETKL